MSGIAENTYLSGLTPELAMCVWITVTNRCVYVCVVCVRVRVYVNVWAVYVYVYACPCVRKEKKRETEKKGERENKASLLAFTFPTLRSVRDASALHRAEL